MIADPLGLQAPPLAPGPPPTSGADLPDPAPADLAPWETDPDWEDDSWRNQAACRATAADLFFPTGRTPGASEQVRAAKSVCRSCEVRETCLLYALETNQDAGIWGGTSEDERRKLRRVWLARRRRVRPTVN